MEIDQQLAKEIIIDHYENPTSKIPDKELSGMDIKLQEEGYDKAHNDSPSCIDNIDGYVLIENGIVKDAKFGGIGCAICTSTTDLVIESIIGKSVEEAKAFIKNYFNMIVKEPYDEEALGKLIIYKNVNKQANRVKCALTGVQAIAKALKMLEVKDVKPASAYKDNYGK